METASGVIKVLQRSTKLFWAIFGNFVTDPWERRAPAVADLPAGQSWGGVLAIAAAEFPRPGAGEPRGAKPPRKIDKASAPPIDGRTRARHPNGVETRLKSPKVYSAPAEPHISVQELAATRPGGRTRDFAYRFTTWLLDIVGSSVLLLVTAPLILVIAILTRLDSPGPVIFRHKRVGVNQRRNQISVDRERRSTKGFGKPFTLYKFRTMDHDSKQRFPELYSYQFAEEALSTLPIKILVGTKRQRGSTSHRSTLGAEGSPDPRLTRVGRWLRRTSLDELPNLWNVLKGDMHLVGPRPDIEENIGQYRPRHLRILDVKPGITGLAQVHGRGHLTFHQTNELDTEYVEMRSLWLDLKILQRTMVVVPKGDGAY